MKQVIFVVMLLASGFSHAADSFNVWDKQMFTGPFTDGVIAVSDPFSVTTGNDSVKIHVTYEDLVHGGLVPNRCDCEVYTVIEEEIAPNDWIPVAAQHSGYRILDFGQQRVIQLSPAFNADGDSDTNIILANGETLVLSKTQGTAPDTFRVKVSVSENTPGALQSLTLTVNGRKFAE